MPPPTEKNRFLVRESPPTKVVDLTDEDLRAFVMELTGGRPTVMKRVGKLVFLHPPGFSPGLYRGLDSKFKMPPEETRCPICTKLCKEGAVITFSFRHKAHVLIFHPGGTTAHAALDHEHGHADPGCGRGVPIEVGPGVYN
jgi:hypothetical protein